MDHTILVHRLHTYFGLTDAVFQWFSSYLTDRTHYVSLFNHCFAFAPVHSGAPQGSVLGSILFNMYIKPLSTFMDTCSIIHHSLADDSKLQISASLTKYPSYFSVCSHVYVESKLGQLRTCLGKTELMLVNTKRTKHLHSQSTSITIGNTHIPFK